MFAKKIATVFQGRQKGLKSHFLSQEKEKKYPVIILENDGNLVKPEFSTRDLPEERSARKIRTRFFLRAEDLGSTANQGQIENIKQAVFFFSLTQKKITMEATLDLVERNTKETREKNIRCYKSDYHDEIIQFFLSLLFFHLRHRHHFRNGTTFCTLFKDSNCVSFSLFCTHFSSCPL